MAPETWAPTKPHPRSTHRSLRTDRETSSRRIRDLIFTSLQSDTIDISVTEDALVHQLDASRAAVRGALQHLAEEGVITRRRRTGTRPMGALSNIDIGDDSIQAAGAEPVGQQLMTTQLFSAGPIIRRMLALPETETHVTMVETRLTQGDAVIGIRSAYHSTRFGEVSFHRGFDRRSLEQAFGVTVRQVESAVGAHGSDDRLAELLEIDVGQAVISRQQLYRGVDQRPIALSFDNFRADKVLLRNTFHQSSFL